MPGKDPGDQSAALRRELCLHDATVIRTAIPVHEPLNLEAIHYVRDVPTRHEQLLGQLAQRERTEVI